MKHHSRTFLALLLCLPVQVLAEPFWCPPGRDMVSNHPVSYGALKPKLDELPLELNKLSQVHYALHAHVADVGAGADLGSVQAFDALLARIMDSSNSNEFLNTSFFDLDTVFNFGVEKTPCTMTPQSLNSQRPALYAVYAAAEAVNLSGRSITIQGYEYAARVLSNRYSEYEAWLLTDGLPQWPWEMWLNGKMVSNDITEPAPLKQWIFARPSVGINLSFASQATADVVPSFAVEIIGFVKYRDRTYKKHIGASLLATVGSENGAGYGLAVRWNGFWAGYVFNDGDEADTIYVGFDLAKLLQDDKKRKKLAEQFADKLIPLIKGRF